MGQTKSITIKCSACSYRGVFFGRQYIAEAAAEMHTHLGAGHVVTGTQGRDILFIANVEKHPHVTRFLEVRA